VISGMKERPILFSAPMVRAILAGTKTQTRRVVKPQPPGTVLSPTMVARDAAAPSGYSFISDEYDDMLLTCPYGAPGDRLWVRETWGRDQADNGGDRHWNRIVYRADPGEQALDNGTPVPWKPSIHMPRWASRITLEVTGVRVERLQDISVADAMAEGVVEVNENLRGLEPCMEWRYAYEDLWESINGAGSWDANPWVWVVEFKRGDPPAGHHEGAPP
jgi:hypothetical protein